MLLEGLGKLKKNPMTSPREETATFQLVSTVLEPANLPRAHLILV
jgi:hypothetical protein